jgi:hypothetical protein
MITAMTGKAGARSCPAARQLAIPVHGGAIVTIGATGTHKASGILPEAGPAPPALPGQPERAIGHPLAEPAPRFVTESVRRGITPR